MKRPEPATSPSHRSVAARTVVAVGVWLALAGCAAHTQDSPCKYQRDPALAAQVDRFGAALVQCTSAQGAVETAAAWNLFETILTVSKQHSLYDVDPDVLTDAAISALGPCEASDMRAPLENVDAAISAMLASFDADGGLLAREDWADLAEDTGGFGIELSVEEGNVVIVSTIPRSPAERAGLRPRDRIVTIDGDGVDPSDVIGSLRGPVGSSGEVVVVRDDGSRTAVTMSRETVYIASVIGSKTPDGYGVVRIRSLNDGTSDELEDVLDDLERKEPLRGLLLDMRANPGGLLTQSVTVSDLFLDGGLIAQVQGRTPDQLTSYYARSGGFRSDVPIVVVIDEKTAAGSELIAAALQAHGRASIIGSRTFGRGTVQTMHPVGCSRALRLTTARLRTALGRELSSAIEPDVRVPAHEDPITRYSASDTVVIKGLALLREQFASRTPAATAHAAP